MEYPALEKFLQTMGMDYFIDIHRQGYGGGRYVCVEVKVRRKGVDEYHQYHCYNKSRDGVRYAEGNMVKDVKDGILTYLGDDKKVDNYFEKKARELAIKFFESEK